MHTKPINIFWTGGWDSTFRLLYILIVEKKAAQPCYIIDTGRRSTVLEFKTMDTLKALLFEEYPHTRDLLLETIIKVRMDIKAYPEITEKYRRLTTRIHLGTQYEWLPRFAEHYRFHDMELGLIQRLHKGVGLQSLMEPELVGEIHECRLRDELKDKDLSIFKYFRFPLFFMNKLDMENVARKHGFFHIMRLTWFCHRPTRDGFPCGRCNPCKIARQSGHSHIPGNYPGSYFVRQARRLFKKAKRKIKSSPSRELR